jgi:small subunit ribosomal protein S20
MAHHKSAKKRIRQTATRRLRNRYHAKTMRNALRALRATKEQGEASKQLPSVVSMIDKLVKSNQIHKNKAGNLKSKLTKFVAKMNEVKEEKAKKSTKGKSTTAKKTTKKAK